jgi:hypothetical protein
VNISTDNAVGDVSSGTTVGAINNPTFATTSLRVLFLACFNRGLQNPFDLTLWTQAKKQPLYLGSYFFSDLPFCLLYFVTFMPIRFYCNYGLEISFGLIS